ncbi:hypothetical protein ACFLYU_03700 [Candidatus Dependentiae bacterium]
MRKVVLCSIISSICFSSSIFAVADERAKKAGKSFLLESPMIPVVDGKSYGVHGRVFGLILQNRREIRKRLYGVPAKNGGRIGMFQLGDNRCCLVELGRIESENEAEYLSKLNYLESNRLKYAADEWQEEKDAIEKEYRGTKAQLEEVLDEAKEDFINFTQDYLEGINGVKEPVLVLVEEFCEKKGIEWCFLLHWGGAEAGAEHEMIRQDIKTIKEFTGFCRDLSDFLEVLAKSCPKGKQLFIDIVKKAKQAKK